jgi:hypothetical protein
MSAVERLGCAEDYRAVIKFRGGRTVWTPVRGLAAVAWGRRRDDWSEATIDVAKVDAGGDCCAKLGDTRTWGHELALYRGDEQEPCWEGPIVDKVERRASFSFAARDVAFWLDRTPVEYDYFWPDPTDTGQIIRTLITDAFEVDDPGLVEWMDVRDTGRMSTTDRLWGWSQPLGEVIRELIGVGVDLFTVGRRLYVISDRTQLDEGAPYRLDAAHFLDELQVREHGLDAAMLGIAVGGQPLDGEGQPIQDVAPVLGSQGGPNDGYDPFYGRVTRWTSSPNTVAQSVADGLASAVYHAGQPPPVDLVVPDGARLSPTAPVSMGQLVPGRKFHVALGDEYCTRVDALFRLHEVDVTWTRQQDEASESVAVSLSSSGTAAGVVP